MFRKLVIFGNVLAAVLLIASYMAPSIHPGKMWLFSIIGLGYPIWLFINLTFIVYWAFVNFKFALISVIAVALGYGNIQKFYALNAAEKSSNKNDISVISYNISNATKGYDKDREKRKIKKEKMKLFLQRFDDEDILCLQEVGTYAKEVISQSLNYPYIHQKPGGTYILSKHKIIRKGEIDFGTITNSCLWADLLIGLDTVRVYSFHLKSNSITADADKVLDNPDLNDDKTWSGIKGIFSKYVSTHLSRVEQAKMIADHMQSSPYRVILCGDMNDTPLSYTYTTLSENLTDNFINHGYGLGSTFNGRIPLLRIDYIFTSKNIKVYNFNIIKEDFSDHYAVASILTLKGV